MSDRERPTIPALSIQGRGMAEDIQHILDYLPAHIDGVTLDVVVANAVAQWYAFYGRGVPLRAWRNMLRSELCRRVAGANIAKE